MKIAIERPEIIRVSYHQEQGDPQYGSCLWAYFDFDTEKYMLNIQSDCGNAAYRWYATPKHESFLHLMGRIDGDYLLNKLFTETEVDVGATLNQLREYLGIGEDDDYIDESLTDEERDERAEAMIELEAMFDEYTDLSEEMAIELVNRWNDENRLEIDDIWECVVMDYTAWQKRIVKIFVDNVQAVVRDAEEASA